MKSIDASLKVITGFALFILALDFASKFQNKKDMKLRLPKWISADNWPLVAPLPFLTSKIK
jgi:hypothetical protein